MTGDLPHLNQLRRKAGLRMQSAALPPCADPDDELLAGEAAALGLDTRKTWHRCTTGEHPAHCRCARPHPSSGTRPR